MLKQNEVLTMKPLRLRSAKLAPKDIPPAAYSPWQNGDFERMNTTVLGTVGRCVDHSGVSPAMMLFGQRTKLYGEMYEDSVVSGVHSEAQGPATALSQKLKIRFECEQALRRHHACDLLRRAVAARTRPVKEVKIGQRAWL